MSDFVGEIRGGIAWATLNRPESLNAFSDDMRDRMIAFLHQAELDTAVRCVVLQGAGGNFMAGGDVKSFTATMEKSPEERRIHFEATCHAMHPIVYLIRRMPKPVLACVQGAAAGLGMSLVLACDLAVAADNAVFTLAYIKLGTTPDGGASFFLPRTVGMKRAMEIALLSDKIDAATAERFGIVNRVVPAARFAEETQAFAERLAAGATVAMGRTKALLSSAMTDSLEAHLQAEGVSFGICSATSDMVKGVAGFIEKRRPVFDGN
jgi:2-(1,2-epoxy-1,2-dihydrophenyl)acetyl-CoA isomerase